MSKKIFVGNLSFQITETDLTNMFGEIGQVESVQIITDRDTGRSKGFGFVQMADDAAAEKAIAQLNGKEVGGRNLTVNEARPMQKRDSGGRGGGGDRRRYWDRVDVAAEMKLNVGSRSGSWEGKDAGRVALWSRSCLPVVGL